MNFLYNKNTANKIGDEIILESFPILNLSNIVNFTDSVTGVTQNRYFDKYFSYSLNGVDYSEYIPLTNSNLQSIQFSKYSIFCAKYKYVRQGISNIGELKFNSIQINGYYTDIKLPIYDESVFGEFFQYQKPETLNWGINVIQKLFHPGILPEYIDRQVVNTDKTNEDFLAYWFTVSHFFAIVVTFARMFRDFDKNQKILRKYLTQKGLFINNTNTLEELQKLTKNFYLEISKRGTDRQVLTADKSDLNINSEILRLISYESSDEFIFSKTSKEKYGWNINNSSPLFKGIKPDKGINKGYEDTKDIIDISKYPTFSLGNQSSVQIISENDKSLLRIEDGTGLGTGIGSPIGGPYDLSKAIIIDNKIDYKIEFEISSDINSYLGFGVLGFDKNNNLVSLSNIRDGIDSNFFFEEELIKSTSTGTFKRIKGYIYGHNQNLLPNNYKTNLGIGNNLRLKQNITKIIPLLIAKRQSSVFKIWDFKVLPLRSPFSLGYIQTNQLIQIYFNNNNLEYSKDSILDILRRYFIPYNSWLKFCLDSGGIIDNDVTSSTTIIKDTIWIADLDSAYCETDGEGENGIFVEQFVDTFE